MRKGIFLPLMEVVQNSAITHEYIKFYDVPNTPS